MKTCNIDGCEKKPHGRGMCRKHHQRWRRHGDPLAGSTCYTDPEASFLARTEPLLWSSCIIWTGAATSHGYGRIYANRRMILAHRYAWEREHGPIPDGMVIDHTCWEPSCVNTEHLRLASHAENGANRSGAQSGRKHDLPRGVTRSRNGYQARVNTKGRQINAGTFPTIERAEIAVKNCRAFYYGEYAGN